MKEIAIKFTSDGVDTNFYRDEAIAMNIKNIQNTHIRLFDQTSEPPWLSHMRLDYGYPYKIFEIFFKLEEKGTIDKLDILFRYKDDREDPKIIDLNYLYKIETDNAAATYTKEPVQMIRNQMVWPYGLRGYAAAGQTIKIVFVESLREGGVGGFEVTKRIGG